MEEFEAEVATHVLIPVQVAQRLKDLSRKTRVRQSEYLREAVEDLLRKYQEAAQAGVIGDLGANG
jgi:predicted DNA-binding protein